jgi:ABC-2 type transport system permease protein
MKPWALLAVAELKLIIRSPLAAGTAILAPLAMGLIMIGNQRNGVDMVVSMQLVALLGFTPYAGATTTLAARRQQLVLKRLRTSPASDREIIGGLLMPLVVLVVVQAVVLVATTIVVTRSWPHAWWPIGLALVGGTALALALAFVTAAVTSGAEMAQLTTLPVFVALFGGTIWVLATAPGEVTWVMMAVPGAAVAQLTRLGWEGTALSFSTVAPPLVAIAVTAAVSAWLAARVFRWQPRS